LFQQNFEDKQKTAPPYYDHPMKIAETEAFLLAGGLIGGGGTDWQMAQRLAGGLVGSTGIFYA